MNGVSYVPWGIVATIIGSAVVVVGSLIVLNLRAIKQCVRSLGGRINKQDTQIEKAQREVKTLHTGFANCKVDCERTFVNKELFLRETGFARRTLEDLSTSVNRLDGKLTVVEKLPQICGNISREIVKEMKNGVSQ